MQIVIVTLTKFVGYANVDRPRHRHMRDQPIYTTICRLNDKLSRENKIGISGPVIHRLLHALRCNREDEEILYEGMLHMCKMLDEFYDINIIKQQIEGPSIIKREEPIWK